SCVHAPPAIPYQAEGHLFSGDVLFAGSVGRTDFEGGDMPTLVRSIRPLIEAYPSETIVLPGHGPATTLGHERESNPFLQELRAWAASSRRRAAPSTGTGRGRRCAGRCSTGPGRCSSRPGTSRS